MQEISSKACSSANQAMKIVSLLFISSEACSSASQAMKIVSLSPEESHFAVVQI